MSSDASAPRQGFPPPAPVFVLFYESADNVAAKAPPVFPAHKARLDEFHARGDLQWMDSCADPGNWMMNRIWPDRRRIATLVVPGGNFAGPLFIRALPLMRRLKRMALGTPAQPIQG